MKRIKIAIVEMYSHAEIVRALTYWLIDFELHLFISSEFELGELARELSDNYPVYIRDEETSIPAFLTKNKTLLDEFQWIIFTTIENNFSFFSNCSWNPKCIFLIHDGNFWLNYSKNISLSSIKNVLRVLRSILFRWPLLKARIINRMDYLLFPNQNICNYFLSQSLVSEEKLFPCIPLWVPRTYFSDKSDEDVIIVLPGSIREDTRNYEFVYQALKQMKTDLTKIVNFVLLGRPVSVIGKKWQADFKGLGDKRLKITSFSSGVEQTEYDEWIKRCHFMVLPLRSKMRFQECAEVGGVTKISGSINDMIGYNKPSLVQEDYFVEDTFSFLGLKFKNEIDLKSKMLNWINFPPKAPNEMMKNENNKWYLDNILSV